MRRRGAVFFLTAVLVLLLSVTGAQYVQGGEEAAEPYRVEFFYENVCASCEGDAEFYELYEQCLSAEERERLHGNVVTYNVFHDSARKYYNSRREQLCIPDGTFLPVLIVGDRWVSGMDQMEELLSLAAGQDPEESAGSAERGDPEESGAGSAERGDPEESGAGSAEPAGAGRNAAMPDQGLEETSLAGQLAERLAERDVPTAVLFVTEACEDCEQADRWILDHQPAGGRTITYNIVQDPCVELLKCMFEEYGVPESEQKVPALFYGTGAATGAKQITALAPDAVWRAGGSEELAARVANAGVRLEGRLAEGGGEKENGENSMGSALTLFGAGLLAGVNPCAVSMLLMLISLILSEKGSVWKNGLLYLGGKYAAYCSIGMTIYLTAAQIDGQLLAGAKGILHKLLALLFAAAGIFYLIDAVRVFRQEYGKIRTQLPAGMRRWNHRLIRRAAGYGGALKPLIILGLGMAVSVGEFFCTGQIYMASITYLLKHQAGSVWPYFLIYVTAMSLPSALMLAIVQKTRNAERISEAMLRHLGAVKLISALLFLGFAVSFLLR